jgi:hypothetical protein
MDEPSSEQVMLLNHGMNLSDQYWVNPVDDPKTWDELNFFTNGFSGFIGEMLLAGSSNPGDAASSSYRTPDAATGGQARKMWACVDDKRYLIKGARDGFIQQEPVNELIATKLYEVLLQPGEYVSYQLEERPHAGLCSLCECMVGVNEELVPAAQLMRAYAPKAGEKHFDHYVRILGELGVEGAAESVARMIVLDAVLANPDRHFNNFGVIRNVETLEVTRVAPLWDNDLALFAGRSKGVADAWDYETHSFIARPQLQLLHCVGGSGAWFEFDEAAFIETARDLLQRYTGMGRINGGEHMIERLTDGIHERIGFINREIYKKN